METETENPQTKCCNCFRDAIQFCKLGVMNLLETYFYWHGKTVARYPGYVLTLSITVTLLSSLGLLKFREEAEMTALWVPQGSKFRDDYEWVADNFPKQLRLNQVIFKADNVLTPEVLQEMFKLQQRVWNINHQGLKWTDVCLKLPVIKKPKCFDPSKFSLFDYFFGRRRKRSTEEEDEVLEDECAEVEMPDLSAHSFTDLAAFKLRMETEGFSTSLAEDVSRKFYPEPYCHFVKSAPTVCLETSILELWASDGEFHSNAMENLTEENILEVVNTRNTSGLFNNQIDLKPLLSDISYNSTGHIVGAGVATMGWVEKVNLTALEEFGSVQRGEALDKFTSLFEDALIEVTSDRSDQPENITTYVIVAKSFFQALESQAFKDAGMLLVGYLIVLLYVVVMIGRCNFVQQRIFLGIGGIMGVAMGIIFSYGVCSALGFWYSPAHTVIPFLMLGIGIDDMFVIIQCRNTLSEADKKKDVVERLGVTLKHAGVAITITSITNFIAFGIGATTTMPALKSFCIYASIGILSIFFFQNTWFTALLAVDEYRSDAKRDGCLCCLLHPSHSQDKASQPSIWSATFRFLARLLVKTPTKIIVVLVTMSCLAGGIYGTLFLTMEFKPEWLMDPSSEVSKWYEAHKKYFSEDGERGFIYLKETNYTENLAKIEDMISRLKTDKHLIRSIDAWPIKFKEFLSYDDPSFDWTDLDDRMFHEKLSHFLFTPMGAKYRIMFKFSSDLECGQAAPRVLLSCMEFSHVMYQSASEWVPAYDRTNQILVESNITVIDSEEPAAIPIAIRYSNWVTDKIIQRELYQNIGSASVAMFITVLIFLGTFRGAAFVIFCVLGTIVEVAGFMYFMGLTINVITCNTLVISIGLCVDFSAHIAHGFISRSGSREERVISTVTEMGPAVLNGGLSTLLAFILLSTSKSYVFMSFFKIFFLICIFGLYHGLIALPVLLALCGPLSQHPGQAGQILTEKTEEEQELKPIS